MWAWNQPCSVCWKSKVNASNFFFLDHRLERRLVAAAHAGIEAVAGDHQVGAVARRRFLVVQHVALEHQFDAQLFAALLQDVQQALAAYAAETVAARGHFPALEVDVDIVPVVEGLQDFACGFLVGRHQVAQRLVGKHHAPAESVVRPVALEHHDTVRRVLLFHQQGEIQAGGAAADTNDIHAIPQVLRSLKRCSLPVSVRGSEGRKQIERGYLYGAICSLTNCCNWADIAGDGSKPGFSTTCASTTCPRSSSGLPTTPHSATAGWRSKASSTSGPAML
jgi:hypothetical protein